MNSKSVTAQRFLSSCEYSPPAASAGGIPSDAARRRLGHDGRHENIGKVGLQCRHAPNVFGFLVIVELLDEALPNLIPDRLEVDVREQPNKAAHQGLEVLQVRPDHAIDIGVLDLDGDFAAIAQDPAMHLADRSGRKCVWIDRLEQRLEVRYFAAQLALHLVERNGWCLFLQNTEDGRDLGR